MEKQIEKHELSESIYMSGYGLERKDCDDIAEQLCHEGYRKQSEVANKICCEIKQEISAALDSNYRVRGELELSDELYYAVNGKISALRGIEGFITELEKKYMEN